MTNYISQIAKLEKRDRFDAIVKVLTENEVSYKIQSLPFHGALGNIIITFNPNSTEKKRVVTAHYDNIPGMPGANDNAAACSILLNLILETKANGMDKPLEFVFFDLEEMGFRGSKYYLMQEVFNRHNVEGVINLDMCGFGNNTVVSIHNGAEKIFPNCLKADVRTLKMLPPGDAYIFIDSDVPTVYVINSTDRDLSWFEEYAETGSRPSGVPEFAYTMHQSNDTPDICNLEQVEKIHRFVYRCLQ